MHVMRDVSLYVTVTPIKHVIGRQTHMSYISHNPRSGKKLVEYVRGSPRNIYGRRIKQVAAKHQLYRQRRGGECYKSTRLA